MSSLCCLAVRCRIVPTQFKLITVARRGHLTRPEAVDGKHNIGHVFLKHCYVTVYVSVTVASKMSIQTNINMDGHLYITLCYVALSYLTFATALDSGDCHWLFVYTMILLLYLSFFDECHVFARRRLVAAHKTSIRCISAFWEKHDGCRVFPLILFSVVEGLGIFMMTCFVS